MVDLYHHFTSGCGLHLSKYPYISFGMKSNRILIGSFHAFPDGLLRSPKKP